MEALWKQASRLKEQVARQVEDDRTRRVTLSTQGVFKQFGAGAYGNSDNPLVKLHQRLEKLYLSTRAAKHFQRDIVRGVEGYIVTGSKQVEIGNKLSDDSQKYGIENTCTSGNTLSKAATYFGKTRSLIEKERGNLLKAFGTQVAEPLRAMVVGAPLEDARHLAQRYDRMRQEADAQVIEVSRRQNRVRESFGNGEVISKLEAAEYKLEELKSNMVGLGKEAVAAMAAVEGQQQRLTLQRLIAMVEAERAYHQKVLEILDHLEEEVWDSSICYICLNLHLSFLIGTSTLCNVKHIETLHASCRRCGPGGPPRRGTRGLRHGVRNTGPRQGVAGGRDQPGSTRSRGPPRGTRKDSPDGSSGKARYQAPGTLLPGPRKKILGTEIPRDRSYLAPARRCRAIKIIRTGVRCRVISIGFPFAWQVSPV